MAKLALLPLIAAIGFLSFLSFSYCDDSLEIGGSVYCDTCRASFPTKLSKPIGDAEVELKCRDRATGDVTLTLTAKTDPEGKYQLTVDGDHEEEICDVTLVQSNDDDCSEIPPGFNSGRVLITSNNGMAEPLRYVNPLGFLKKEPLKECREAFRELGLVPSEIQTL